MKALLLIIAACVLPSNSESIEAKYLNQISMQEAVSRSLEPAKVALMKIDYNPINSLPTPQNTYDPFEVHGFGEKYYPFQSCWKTNCIIEHDGGGAIRDFAESAKKTSQSFSTVVISGDCISACTGFADMIKDQVCITSSARFRYHTDNMGWIPDYYSKWTLDWISEHGGFPKLSTRNLLTMDYENAKKHWRTCNSIDLKEFYLSPKTNILRKVEANMEMFPYYSFNLTRISHEKELEILWR